MPIAPPARREPGGQTNGHAGARASALPGAAPVDARARGHLAVVALVLAAALLTVHGAAVRFPLLLDEARVLLDNPVYRGELSWWTLLDGRAARAEVPLAGQPLVLLSHLFGRGLLGQRAFAFRAINLALALAVGLGAYRLLLARLRAPALALFAACVFVVHPLNVEAVAAVGHRGTLLSALLTLLALGGIAQARAARPVGRQLWRAAAALATLSAGLSLPALAVAPLLLVLHDLWPAPHAGADPAEQRGERVARHARDWLVLAAGASAAVLWRHWALAERPLWSADTWQQPAPLTLARAGERALQWLWGVWAAAVKLFAPRELSAAYQERYFHGAFEWSVAIAMVLGLLVAVGLALALRRRAADASLGIMLGLAAYLPALSDRGDSPAQADHHGYLALLFWIPAALLLLCAAGARLVTAAGRAGRALRARLAAAPLGIPAPALGGLALLALLAQPARQRVGVWRDDLTLWDAAVVTAPLSGRAWAQLAQAELAGSRLDMAETSARRALELDPGLVAAHWMLARITLQLGSVEVGCRILAEAHRQAGEAPRPDLLAELALCHNRLARPDLALALAETALRRAPWLELATLQRAAAQRAIERARTPTR